MEQAAARNQGIHETVCDSTHVWYLAALKARPPPLLVPVFHIHEYTLHCLWRPLTGRLIGPDTPIGIFRILKYPVLSVWIPYPE